MTSFDLFPKLPPSIRYHVWKQVASAPRVVGIREDHFCRGEDNYTTIITTTRPPAMLSACREAREIGLSIYKQAQEGMQNRPPTSRDIPIYVNPEVDIIYRGRRSCEAGDMYKMRCRDWSKDTEPLAMTRTLAIDARGVTRFRMASPKVIMHIGATYPKEEWDEIMLNMFINTHYGTRNQIIKLAERGVREIIYVVGNDDDLSEITLVPLPEDPAQLSARELQVVKETGDFGAGVGRWWERKEVAWPLPTFKVIKVERKPLKEFTLFPRLPMEIQLLIWNFATVNYPIVRTMLTDDENCDTAPEVLNYRAPALAHACRNSRNTIWKGLDMSKVPDKTLVHEPLNDVVLLQAEGIFPNYKAFATKGYESIGFLFNDDIYWDPITATEAKTFVCLKRIFILLGKQKASCEMTMEIVPDFQPPRGEVHEWRKAYRASRALMWAQSLREDLEKTSKKWKAYQKRRVKQGKSSPDWVVPTVKVAYLKPICEVVSPYSY
ncbi:hypothetical protein L207DRAFT_169695 [Hyaloscypha variabilis F]|uniref:2EXR domain-containing protein n=1 Tax=Hyaloscypha variabilis (strain UAMH 11265 / GT02V1 / F) TaxID=1149755 RepID=A0A2J6R478_HYAVF|nr:hypothetical protein L207DRAFT_169695 [Hyaloscypha variabilis F]